MDFSGIFDFNGKLTRAAQKVQPLIPCEVLFCLSRQASPRFSATRGLQKVRPKLDTYGPAEGVLGNVCCPTYLELAHSSVCQLGSTAVNVRQSAIRRRKSAVQIFSPLGDQSAAEGEMNYFKGRSCAIGVGAHLQLRTSVAPSSELQKLHSVASAKRGSP